MIAYGMLYSIVVGLPILAAVSIGSAVLQRQGRAQRGVWLAALALAIALPLVLLATPETTPDPAPVPVVRTGLTGLPAVVSVPAPPPVTVPIARSRLGVDELLLSLWLAASLLLALRWIVASVRLGRMTRGLEQDVVDGVRVSLTADLGPAVAGVWTPRILAPEWLLGMPAAQRSLVLVHEAEHIRARDPWLLFVSRFARMIAPWNPVVWLLSHRLVGAIELDCDLRVLRRHPDVGAYGTTLLSVSSRTPGPIVPAAAFAESDGPLRQRILAMTTPPRTVSILGLLTTLAFGVLLLVGVFEVPIPSASPVIEDNGSAEAESVGSIAGVITDGASDRPLQYVQVSVVGTGLGTLTNEAGEFALPRVPAGQHQVEAEFIGHQSVVEPVVVVSGESAPVDLQMRQTAIQMPGVVVFGAGESEDRAAREPLIFVDGIRIEDPAMSGEAYLASLDPATVERVEILKGQAAAALFGEEASGGVVQIFMKAETEPEPRRTSTLGQPIFTPHSVAPAVLNLEEVQRAMAEAYPEELRDEGIGGTVGVYFFVDGEGAVQDVRIDESSGHPALDDAALRVAGVYRFSPALNRDQPVPVWVSFPITFLRTR